MKSLLSLITILLLQISANFSFAQEVKFNHLTVEDGLSSTWVTSFAKDDNGFLWIGTSEGLNVYDGYNLTVYISDAKDPRGLLNSGILGLTKDGEGNIWAGTYMGLYKYNSNTNSFQSFVHDEKNENSPINDKVNCLMADNDGYLWLGTASGLDKFNLETKAFHHFKIGENDPEAVSHGNVGDILEDSNGNVWVGTQKGLNVLKKGSNQFKKYFHNLEDKNSISNNYIQGIVEDENGSIWIVTFGGGLSKYVPKTDSFINFTKENSSLTSNRIISLTCDKEGYLYIGTEDRGINIFSTQEETFRGYEPQLDNAQSLNSVSIHSLFYDQANKIIWSGTYNGGVNYFSKRDKGFIHYKAKTNGLNNNKILSVHEMNNKNILIGTDGGGINIYDQKKGNYSYYMHDKNKPGSLGGNAVLSVYEDSKGNIYAGAYINGFNILQKGSNKFYQPSYKVDEGKDLSEISVFQIREDKRGKIVFRGEIKRGQPDLLFYNPINKEVTSFEEEYGVKLNGVRTYIEDKEGNYWIGNNHLSFFNTKTKELKEFKDKNAPSEYSINHEINTLQRDSEGKVWIGTRKAGLVCFDPKDNSFKSYTNEDGLPDNGISGIMEDKNGNLWISTKKGLAKFEFGVNKPTKPIFRVYSVDDGIQGSEFKEQTFYKGKSGNMYFGGNNGFNSFNPENVRNNEFIPPIVITGLKIFNKDVSVGKEDSPLEQSILNTREISLNHTQSVFTFEFAALNFNLSRKNKYAYTLEGFDKKLNYVDHKRTATYTNLDAGTYTFKVLGSNNDGIWNEEGISMTVNILPPWWETWWFRSIALIIFLGSGVVFYQVRTHQMKKRQEELENQVEDRTKEIRSANLVLQEKHEEIQVQAEELQQQAEEMEIQRDYLEDSNKKVLAKNEEIEVLATDLKKFNVQISIQNEKLIDSINYGLRIQQAILPSPQQLNEAFADHFVLYRPKDVVSGDFYWFNQTLERTYIAAVDCTGHGVPGAFMSLIGSSLLNRIVNEQMVHDPGEILTRLNQGIFKALKQDHSKNTDGMDVSLISVEQMDDEYEIVFSGAKNSLFYFEKANKNIARIKGDRKGIGGIHNDGFEFQSTKFFLSKGDCIYLATDGIIDQNDKNRKRFSTKRFSKALLDISEFPLAEQGRALESALEVFQEKEEQRDDITVVGIKL